MGSIIFGDRSDLPVIAIEWLGPIEFLLRIHNDQKFRRSIGKVGKNVWALVCQLRQPENPSLTCRARPQLSRNSSRFRNLKAVPLSRRVNVVWKYFNFSTNVGARVEFGEQATQIFP